MRRSRHHQGEVDADRGKAFAGYGVDVIGRLEVLKTSLPPSRGAGVKVKDVAELSPRRPQRCIGRLGDNVVVDNVERGQREVAAIP
jgi:hypothetical protein